MNRKIDKPKYTTEFYKAIDWLNKNKGKLPPVYTDEIDHELYEEPFDYPYYWGIPKKISFQLTPDEVDYLQEAVTDWHNPIINKYKKKKSKK